MWQILNNHSVLFQIAIWNLAKLGMLKVLVICLYYENALAYLFAKLEDDLLAFCYCIRPSPHQSSGFLFKINPLRPQQWSVVLQTDESFTEAKALSTFEDVFFSWGCARPLPYLFALHFVTSSVVRYDDLRVSTKNERKRERERERKKERETEREKERKKERQREREREREGVWMNRRAVWPDWPILKRLWNRVRSFV